MTDWTDFFRRGALTVNVNLCVTGTGGAALGPIVELLHALTGKVERMAGALDRIEAELTKLTDAGDGMALLLETLSAEIRANSNSVERMEALADKMDAKANVWIDATLENTPSAPQDPPAGPPAEASFKKR